MTYARARLYLGISGVGFFVTSSAAALWFDLPHRLFRHSLPSSAIALTLALFILLSFPFDLLGGYILPHRFNRTSISPAAFLLSWLRGVFIQALIMGLCAFLILQAASRAGTLAGIAVFTLLMFALLLAQLPVARLIAGIRPTNTQPSPVDTQTGKHTRQPEILIYQSSDPAFVGGLVGLPGREKLVLPAAWLQSLPANLVSMQLMRRTAVLVTGARSRGVALALLWNLTGFAFASQCPGATLLNAPGLIATGLWFTLWSFVGLLLLPSFNRPGVIEADRYATEHGVTEQTLHQGIVTLDQLQDDEPDRSRWIERVFHPIPSVSSREQAIRNPATRGAWQGARLTLYLSWACLGFLARAVHCNAGRPELWVLFPGD